MADVPVRLSVHDVDYDPALGNRILVTLDGVIQKDVEAYDMGAGTVTRAKRDEHGHLTVADDEIVIEVVSGNVEATWRAEQTPPPGSKV